MTKLTPKQKTDKYNDIEAKLTKHFRCSLIVRRRPGIVKNFIKYSPFYSHLPYKSISRMATLKKMKNLKMFLSSHQISLMVKHNKSIKNKTENKNKIVGPKNNPDNLTYADRERLRKSKWAKANYVPKKNYAFPCKFKNHSESFPPCTFNYENYISFNLKCYSETQIATMYKNEYKTALNNFRLNFIQKENDDSAYSLYFKSLQVCGVCQQPTNQHTHVNCVLCSDAYHSYCVPKYITQFQCGPCKNKPNPFPSIHYKFSEKDNKKFSTPLTLQSNIPQDVLDVKRLELLEIISSLGFNFSDSLSYNQSTLNKNLSYLEPTKVELSLKNQKIFQSHKLLSSQAYFPAISIKNDPIVGNYVYAYAEILPNTLLCEYCGDVVSDRDILTSSNDSNMRLITNPSSSLSLTISPMKNTNIAKFFSGINNLTGIKNINVTSIKISIDGQIHILLYTCKKIEIGEILYYDYNGCMIDSFKGMDTKDYI